jgi:hypothetical protein
VRGGLVQLAGRLVGQQHLRPVAKGDRPGHPLLPKRRPGGVICAIVGEWRLWSRLFPSRMFLSLVSSLPIFAGNLCVDGGTVAAVIRQNALQPRSVNLVKAVCLAAVMVLSVGTAAYLMPRSDAATGVYPVKVSGNHRNLATASGDPYFLDVDTAWTWLSNVPDRSEADAYLDARKAQGFNTIISFMASFRSKNFSKAGVPAFVGSDIGKPNDAYFATVDALVQDAADRGMQVMMGPLNLSDNLFSTPDGCPTLAQWAAYGTYVGNRYKNYDNIIWFMGGDHDAHSTWGDTVDYTPYIDAMANAIKAADGRHLMTYHPSADTFELSGKSWLDFYSFQENRADSSPYSYQRVKPYYEYSPVKPVIDLEPGYETGDAMTGVATTPFMVRRNAWWAFLQGAMGVTYGGNRATWYIGENGAYAWQPYVNLGGARATGLMTSLLAGSRWADLVPDSTHQLVTSGYGTFGNKDYVTAGATADGAFGVVYLPTGRSFTLAMSRFSGAMDAAWFDPNSGASTAVAGGALANTGSHSFTMPGSNSAGDKDWLLVLTPSQTTPPTSTSTTTTSPTTTTSGTTTTTTTSSTTTTTTTTTTSSPTGTGLTGRYYRGKGFTGSLLLTRVDPTVDFAWANGAPASGVPADNFSVRWTGQLSVPTTGRYTIGFNGNDGFRVYVDGSLLIDSWTDHNPAVYKSRTVSLTGGRNASIVVEFYERTGYATAQLYWSGPGFGKQIIPTGNLIAG